MAGNPEKIKILHQIDGTTVSVKKCPLLLKEFFETRTASNEKSMT
jgi:hypothetical protein